MASSSEEAEFVISHDEESSRESGTESECEWQDADSSASDSIAVRADKGDDEAWRDGGTPRRSSRSDKPGFVIARIPAYITRIAV